MSLWTLFYGLITSSELDARALGRGEGESEGVLGAACGGRQHP